MTSGTEIITCRGKHLFYLDGFLVNVFLYLIVTAAKIENQVEEREREGIVMEILLSGSSLIEEEGFRNLRMSYTALFIEARHGDLQQQYMV